MWLYNQVLGTNLINQSKIERAIFILDISKLIYRFPCALKFDIKDKRIDQLRINSWGKKFVEETDFLQNEWYKRVKNFFVQYYENNKTRYSMLIHLLKIDLKKYDNSAIKKINKELYVKLLS